MRSRSKRQQKHQAIDLGTSQQNKTTGHDPWFESKNKYLCFKNKSQTQSAKRILTKLQNDQVALSKRSPYKKGFFLFASLKKETFKVF